MKRAGERTKAQREEEEGVMDKLGDKINELKTDAAEWWRGTTPSHRNKDN
jgi:hypothetical protein